jgi:hypothetical protein
MGKSDTKDTARHDARETDATAPTRPPETLRLAGATTRLNLRDHVGHTVSVTGLLVPEDRIVTTRIVLSDAPGGEKTDRKPEIGGKAPIRVFNERSATHVGAECK